MPGRDLGAGVAGFVFAFNPWHVAQAMHHAHVSGIEFLPLFVLFYLLALERKSLAWLAGAAVDAGAERFVLLVLPVLHALFLGLSSVCRCGCGDGQWPRGWPLAAPVLCAGLAALLLSPWLAAMAGAGSASVASIMSAATCSWPTCWRWSPFRPPICWRRYGSGIYAALTGNAWEGTVYLGLANLAFLAWALTAKGQSVRQKRLLHYALGGMIFFAVIAGGEALHVGGHVTPLHLPGVILAKLPLFANVRTPPAPWCSSICSWAWRWRRPA